MRAWTFPVGATAPQAAGVIHTDFEKGFIRAEVISFEDYKRAGYNLLPSGAKDRPSQLYVIIYTIWMIVVGILPVFGITGELTLSYTGAALVLLLGLWVLSNGMKLLKSGDDKVARKLMLSSIGYLTGMQLIYVIDRFI